MNIEAARSIYGSIEMSSLAELKGDLVTAALRYARLRVDWLLADAEGRAGLDFSRTSAHDALIAACDILARNMTRQGEDASWRSALGDDRGEIGDFAVHIHFILGLSAR